MRWNGGIDQPWAAHEYKDAPDASVGKSAVRIANHPDKQQNIERNEQRVQQTLTDKQIPGQFRQEPARKRMGKPPVIINAISDIRIHEPA